MFTPIADMTQRCFRCRAAISIISNNVKMICDTETICQHDSTQRSLTLVALSQGAQGLSLDLPMPCLQVLGLSSSPYISQLALTCTSGDTCLFLSAIVIDSPKPTNFCFVSEAQANNISIGFLPKAFFPSAVSFSAV